MRWITSLFVVLVLLAGAVPGAPGAAPVPVPPAVEAISGPVAESACADCREIVSDCRMSSCEVPGVFAGRTGAAPAHSARIAERMAGNTRVSGFAWPPIPPPPRG